MCSYMESFFHLKKFICLCLSVSRNSCMCVDVCRGQKGIESPGADVRVICELPDVGAGN